jgi:enoyl-CoA hydratase
MKPGLKISQQSELVWTVDPMHTITLGLGTPSHLTVFATPSMIMLMERAAREVLRPFLEPGEETVGVEVSVEHLAGAPLGATVRGVATVTGIEERRISFDIAAYHGERILGRGRHTRAVARVERLIENLSKIAPNPGGSMHIRSNTGELPQFTTLLVAVAGKVATVTLNRPKSLNAVDTVMTSELEQLVAWLAGHATEVRVVILTGAGTAFSAGDDVKELGSLSLETARELSLRQAQLYLAFESLPQPIIAAVNGRALGAGCVCAYSCDFRIASHAATFGMPEIRLGWTPGYGLAQLTALIGKARALDLCLTGRTITSREAHDWGLVHELVSGSMLMERARKLAADLLLMPALALRETKRTIHADEGPQSKTAHRLDTEAYLRCLQAPDAQEGLAAFRDKRSPRFQGE